MSEIPTPDQGEQFRAPQEEQLPVVSQEQPVVVPAEAPKKLPGWAEYSADQKNGGKDRVPYPFHLT